MRRSGVRSSSAPPIQSVGYINPRVTRPSRVAKMSLAAFQTISPLPSGYRAPSVAPKPASVWMTASRCPRRSRSHARDSGILPWRHKRPNSFLARILKSSNPGIGAGSLPGGRLAKGVTGPGVEAAQGYSEHQAPGRYESRVGVDPELGTILVPDYAIAENSSLAR